MGGDCLGLRLGHTLLESPAWMGQMKLDNGLLALSEIRDAENRHKDLQMAIFGTSVMYFVLITYTDSYTHHCLGAQ